MLEFTVQIIDRGLGAIAETDFLLEALGQQSRQQMMKDEVRFSPVNDPYSLMLRAGQDFDAARWMSVQELREALSNA